MSRHLYTVTYSTDQQHFTIQSGILTADRTYLFTVSNGSLPLMHVCFMYDFHA